MLRGTVNNSATIRKLQELIAALDRRMPGPHPQDESGIAEEAAALKAEALEQIALLEQLGALELTPGQDPQAPFCT
jgi:hypothetical protein